jgi:hypothetical protein
VTKGYVSFGQDTSFFSREETKGFGQGTNILLVGIKEDVPFLNGHFLFGRAVGVGEGTTQRGTPIKGRLQPIDGILNRHNCQWDSSVKIKIPLAEDGMARQILNFQRCRVRSLTVPPPALPTCKIRYLDSGNGLRLGVGDIAERRLLLVLLLPGTKRDGVVEFDMEMSLLSPK